MSFWDFRRGIAGVRLLLEYGTEAGLAPAELLRGSRVSAEHLADPNAEILALQELRVVENLMRKLRRPPGLGLALGTRYRIATFGLWGYGLISSPTLGAALEMALRFLPLTFAFSAITAHVRGDEVVLTFGAPELAPGVSRLLVERDMACAAALMRQIAGEDFRLSRFELAPPGRTPGERASDIESLAGVRPVFGAGQNALAFSRHVLARRLPQADPATVAMCEQMCRELLERRRAHVGTATLVQHYLGAQPAGLRPSLAALAGGLNMSERTLKRRLQGEGTSFRQIVVEARAGLAAELVRGGESTITEIAERLGYADLSSFSQAFKRWHGSAPENFRREASR